MGSRGIFIVIEGSDGAGKSTQFELLKKHLEDIGHTVTTFKFPMYDEPSSYFVRRYLAGDYGAANDIGPYTTSLFYALDRFEAAPRIRAALDAGEIVLVDRFTGSNMAHQGTKIMNAEQRRGYFIWLDNLEFEMLKVPRPDISLVLRLPAETSVELLEKTGKKKDIHENLEHMKRTVLVFDDMCQLFPKDFQRIDCVRSGELLPIETIQELLRKKIEPLLPEPTPEPKAQALKTNTEKPEVLEEEAVANLRKLEKSVKAGNPYIRKNKDGMFEITDEGKKFLDETTTNSTGNVYGFTEKLSPMTIAAAMARLSRRGDDMRVTILDEFATAAGKDESLLKRIITSYGDDSVQQLTAQHIVVENASQLLTKKLEWGRLAAYLEQSTRYIYYDQKDPNGNYKYHTPEYLQPGIKTAYKNHMDEIFDLYSDMVHKLTDYIIANDKTTATERDAAWKGAVRAQACDAIRPVLPVATTSTVGIFTSGQALESLIMHLLSDDLLEARVSGEQILAEARKVTPAFLERADKPERGGAWTAYQSNTRAAVRKLASEVLPANHASETEPVQLTSFWPRNEIDLVPDMLYEHSDLPLKEIEKEVAKLGYNKRLDIFEAYIGERLNRRHKPGRALEKAHYSWDLVCDYGIFRDLQRHRMVDDLEWQSLTPRYGYEVPKLVEDAGLADDFEKCFDISLKLHSLLQENGYTLEAQYATLLGHRMRWKVTMNARETFHFNELRTSPQGHPGYRKLVQQMHEKLAEVHPMLAESMKFVNQGEDEALTRLAAERYTQFKLQQLDQGKTDKISA